MPKPLTDVLFWIDHSDGPFRTVYHVNLKKNDGNPVPPIRNHSYPMLKQYAQRTRYGSMPKDLKWIKLEFSDECLKELFRAKRVGILRFKEPPARKCSTCEHHSTCTILSIKECPIPEAIMPIHISQMKWSSGEKKE